MPNYGSWLLLLLPDILKNTAVCSGNEYFEKSRDDNEYYWPRFIGTLLLRTMCVIAKKNVIIDNTGRLL